MGDVVKTETGYKIESSSRKGTFYDVDLAKPFCTCPAFRFQALRKGGVCKHVQSVQQHVAAQHQDVYNRILTFLKAHGAVESVALIEQFGEGTINEMLRQGQLIEERGMIRVMV